MRRAAGEASAALAAIGLALLVEAGSMERAARSGVLSAADLLPAGLVDAAYAAAAHGLHLVAAAVAALMLATALAMAAVLRRAGTRAFSSPSRAGARCPGRGVRAARRSARCLP